MTTAQDPVPQGLLLVDKPAGPTSHDVVGRVRAIMGLRRVGHAGTLDPMATGLLVIALGRATRLLGHLALATKSYTATIRLGAGTLTDDAQGERTGGADAEGIDEAQLAAAMARLTGDLQQVPSAVSAVKVAGRRAYARVRAGEDVVLPPRPVRVTRFAPTAPARRQGGLLDVDVIVDCSTGTYIRALARDLGAALGVGGHLTALRRVAVGPFQVAEAVEVYPDGAAAGGTRPEITDALRTAVTAAVLAPRAAARRAFPARELGAAQAIDVGHGRALPPAGIGGVCAAFGPDGELVALLRERDGVARPVLVWQAAG